MQQKATQMSRKSSLIAQKACDLLRALLWTRKGEFALNIFRKLVKKVVQSTNESSRALLYGDHEFSFQNTPVVHVKMHRAPPVLGFRMPHIPCIKPWADRDDGFDDDDDAMCRDHGQTYGEEEEGIDKRAQEFIAKFYEEMKLQRQISCL